MLRVGLVGIGFMGRGHLDQYIRLMKEGAPVKLVAVCDIDGNKFNNVFIKGNMENVGCGTYDFSPYHCYTDFDEMIANEELDYVDMPLPTYLHSYYAIKAMKAGLNVLCEKPMARTPEQCQMMIDTAKATGKTLMIAQCLRFWPAYETLKHYVDSGELGKPVFARLYRGGSTPAWSYQDWLKDEVRSGGCLLDQHVHDVDTIQWLFGVPEAVSTLGCEALPGAGFDAVSTNYRFPEGFVCTAQDDWSQNGDGLQDDVPRHLREGLRDLRRQEVHRAPRGRPDVRGRRQGRRRWLLPRDRVLHRPPDQRAAHRDGHAREHEEDHLHRHRRAPVRAEPR